MMPSDEYQNQIEFVNAHAEIIIVNKRALVEIGDLDKVKSMRWSNHPRGPIHEIVLSKSPRKKKYVLMSKLIYGKAVSFHNGNRYDLRRFNVTDRQHRIRTTFKNGMKAGIFYYRGDWHAQGRLRGKTFRKSFSVKKYGNETAQRMAYAARKTMLEHGIEEAKRRSKIFNGLDFELESNEIKSCDFLEPNSILNFAKLYAERYGLPDTMIPHLHTMLQIGGGRTPKINRKTLSPVNIYEGNQEYENCVVEIERDEETHQTKGFQFH